MHAQVGHYYVTVAHPMGLSEKTYEMYLRPIHLWHGKSNYLSINPLNHSHF